jgi:hypothetical protein
MTDHEMAVLYGTPVLAMYRFGLARHFSGVVRVGIDTAEGDGRHIGGIMAVCQPVYKYLMPPNDAFLSPGVPPSLILFAISLPLKVDRRRSTVRPTAGHEYHARIRSRACMHRPDIRACTVLSDELEPSRRICRLRGSHLGAFPILRLGRPMNPLHCQSPEYDAASRPFQKP